MKKIEKMVICLMVVIIFVFSVIQIEDSVGSRLISGVGEDTSPPTIEIVNPTEGYFHFSGIRLFPTQLDIVADTMGFGGFRVRPVQVRVTDNVDSPQNISVYMYVYDDEQGQMNYNSNTNLHERKWIGPDRDIHP